ncbi:MAG: hypothetical protein HUJ26_20175 [Planctomycetaceae bacterium]|nr:hypothetical protein [Planctomycetaceae bacterium]
MRANFLGRLWLSILALALLLSSVVDAQEMTASELLNKCQLGKPVDLLAEHDLVKLAKTGSWELDGGLLSANSRQISELYIPYSLPERYIIKAKLKRESGRGAFGFGITMGKEQTSLILDGWGKRFSGLHKLDGREASFPENPTRVEKMLFTDGKESEIQIIVLARQIIVVLDGQEIIRWEGDPQQLKRTSPTPRGREQMPYLYSVRTKWSLSQFEITPIDSAPDDALLAERKKQEADDLPMAEIVKQCDFGKTVDLLSLPQLFNLSPRGGWSLADGVITSNPGKFAELYVPYEYPDRYLIRAKVKRESGIGNLNLGLVMGNGATSVILDGNGGGRVGLYQTDGNRDWFRPNPASTQGSLFEDGQERELQILVLSNGIFVAIDDGEIVRWRGHSKRLTRGPQPPRTERIRMPYLYSLKSKWAFSKFEIVPIKSAPDDDFYLPSIPLMTESELFDKVRPPVSMYDSLDKLRSAPDHTLLLDIHHTAYPVVEYLRGGLVREISRQALSLSARDELSMSTRDRAQLEAFPLNDRFNRRMRREPLSAPLSVFTELMADGRARIQVLRAGDRFTYMPLYQQEFKVSPETPYCDLVGVLEELSRHDFCGVLEREYSVTRNIKTWEESAPVPAQAESLLKKWNVFSQFLGVRELHRVIRESGESPERLAALSRGYARMGLVTSLYFGAYSKVYSARALLYSERLVVKSESSAASLWNRAYVRALVGLPAAAHRDLRQAAEIESVEKPPAWVHDIELYYEGDVRGLKQRLEAPSTRGLTAFLYWKLQTCRASSLSRYDGYYQLMEQEPDSLHALLSTARNEGSLGTKRVAFTTAEYLPQLVKKYLSLMPGLPASVKNALPSSSSITLEELPAIVNALKEAGRYGVDGGEPSLDALGQLIQEALFLTSYQLLDYQSNWLSIGDERVREEADRLSSLLEGHCAQSLIKPFGRSGEERVKLQRDFLVKADTKCLGQSCELYFARLEDEYELNTEEAMNAIFAHEDFIDHEMARKMNRRMSDERFLHWLQQLERVAPHSPTAIEFRISKAPETCGDKIENWEKRYPLDASLQTMFASYYMSQGMFDDAERCVQKRIELEQSYDAYKQLAKMEKLRGDLEGWVEASLESLKYPVTGLEHASTNSAIARHYLDQGEPEKAEPYAEAAASTGASWAMSVAADVQEALRNLESADRYHRTNYLRYNKGMEWYWFRMRSGFGDLQETGQILLEQNRDQLDRTEELTYDDFKFGYLMYLTGEEDRAYTRFKAICDSASYPVHLLACLRSCRRPQR